MDRFWILTYLDMNEQVCRKQYDNEDEAKDAWYTTPFALFLDEVIRLRRNV